MFKKISFFNDYVNSVFFIVIPIKLNLCNIKNRLCKVIKVFKVIVMFQLKKNVQMYKNKSTNQEWKQKVFQTSSGVQLNPSSRNKKNMGHVWSRPSSQAE